MSASRTERLLNLLIALLNTTYGLRRSELRDKVYHDTTSTDVAFGRMFERDKGELRHFGFDVETVTDKGWGSDDPATTRYRIGKDSNRLPDVSLTPAECTVLILAAQLWEHAALGSAAVNAVRKLQASGGLVDAELPAGVQPRIRPAGQAFEDLVAAMHAQHPVSFRYLAGSTGKEEERLVEPWGLGSRFGQWYLVAHDRTRGDKRFFRLSRLTSAVTVLEKEQLHPAGGLQRARPNWPGWRSCRSGPPSSMSSRAGCTDSANAPSRAPSPERRRRAARRRPGPPQRAVPGRRDARRGTRLLRAPGPRGVPARARQRPCGAAWPPRPTSPRPPSRRSPSRRLLRRRRAHRHGRKRTSEDQLTRMLQLVPFLVHNQGLHISEVAQKFGITRKELEADLRILICSGLPEGYPDDLLDIQWDDDHVTITEDLDLNRPVRFTVEEACALLTGLETLNGLPELAEGGALESVTLKLMAAAGEEGLKAAALSGPEVGPANSAALETAREAIRTGAQLRLRYFSPLRDSVSERDIDPLRLYSLDNTWYLEAYCHSAAGPAQLPAGPDRSPGSHRPARLGDGCARRQFPRQALHPERRRHRGRGGTDPPRRRPGR